MTVSEMLDRISSAELTEWMAVYELEAEEQAKADKKRRS
jgi:hypothetical protein